MKILGLLLSATLLISCGQTKNENTTEDMMPVEANNGIGDGAPSLDMAMINTVEKAHSKQAFLDNEMVSFNIVLNFGGSERLNGSIDMTTDTNKLRINKKDGSAQVFDGKQLYVTPATANTQGARFGVFTWTYFFALPYKLADSGVNIELKDKMQMAEDQMMNAFKMTFDAGTGDAPDDYYMVYTNDQNQMMGAGYIVTFGGTPTDKAEENAHAIVYENYKKVDGIPIATNWKFYNWTAEKGIYGDAIGDATITNVKFGTAQSLFDIPEDSKLVE